MRLPWNRFKIANDQSDVYWKQYYDCDGNRDAYKYVQLMKKLLYILLIVPILTFSQDQLTGMIMEANSENKHIPLAGANVYWLDTTVGTVTDIDGKFTIPYKQEYTKLVVSFVGFKTDTLTIASPKMVQHWLQPTSDLDEVTITTRKQTTAKSYLQAENVMFVSSDELLKAACCNLSESFEMKSSRDFR